MTILTKMVMIYARSRKQDVIPLGSKAIVGTTAQGRIMIAEGIGNCGLPALQGLR